MRQSYTIGFNCQNLQLKSIKIQHVKRFISKMTIYGNLFVSLNGQNSDDYR